MGILDDAIREHLDLKRSLGADDDELKQLEDEAFGPPARPGDPDFPDSEDADDDAPGAEEGADAATAVAEPAGEASEMPAAEATDDDVPEEGPPSSEHALFDQALDEPAPEHEAAPAEPEAEAEPAAPEEAPAAVPEAAAESPEEPDLDLGELDLEIEEAELPPLDPNPPIESLETVEHQVELDTAEHPPPAEPQTGEHEESDEGDGDDVLADTPEFLRDAPEDDDLWFEQGEPKDFDFDE